MNIATRSGVNEWHGEAYEFLRKNWFDARNFTNSRDVSQGSSLAPNPQSPFERNQFGADGGGRLIKDKTFIFLSYEGLPQRQAIPLTSTVLTDAQRAQAFATSDSIIKSLLPLIPTPNSPGGVLIASAHRSRHCQFYPALSASSPIFAGRPLANIHSLDSIANSIYNGLWITVKKRFAKGLLLDSSYTFSKSIDDASRTNLNFAAGSQGPQDSNNIRGDRGLSDFDARHHWVLSGIYDLPFKGNRFVAGWEVATAVLLHSGNPINFHTNNTAFLGIGTLRPSVTGPVLTDYTPATNRNAANVTYIQNPSVFYCGVPGNQTCTGAIGNTFGNLGRNVVIGPGFANLDVSLTKSTRLTEKLTWQVRADAFNLPNHPNFAQPSSSNFFDTLGGATFNLLTNTRSSPGDSGSSRQLQLSMKLIF